MKKTGDKGQEPESAAGLAQVYFRWKETCVNPEYEPVREKYADSLGEISAKAKSTADARKKKLREERRKKRLQEKKNG